MANNMISKDLGPATAYAIAVENGYTGTEEQWASEIANASNNAQTASQKASDAEAYAAGTRGGEAVDSDDPAYQNNAEYYSGEAADSAEAAAGSATSAAESAATASAAYNVNLLAPNFVQETAYPAGQHVINDGEYYVLPNGHEANTTWANTTKTQLTVGAEAADLKSALSGITYRNGYVRNNSGTIGSFTANNDYKSIIVPVLPGEVYYVYGSGASTARLWSLHGSDKTTKRVADSAEVHTISSPLELTVQDGEYYLVFNTGVSATSYGIIGGTGSSSPFNIRGMIRDANSNINGLQNKDVTLKLIIDGTSDTISSSRIKSGKYVHKNDGSIRSSDDYIATDYLFVNEKVVALTFNSSSTNAGYYFYDKDKNPISGSGGDIYNISGVYSEISVPANAVYLRISCLANKQSDFEVYTNLYGLIEKKITDDRYVKTIRNDLVSNGTAFLPDCTITKNGTASDNNYGLPGVSYKIDHKAVTSHIYFEFKFTEPLSFDEQTGYDTTDLAVVYGNACKVMMYATSAVFENYIVRPRIGPRIFAGTKRTDTYERFSSGVYEPVQGNYAFSVQYTNTVDSNSSGHITFNATSCDVEIDGTSSSIECSSSTTLHDLVSALNEIDGIEAKELTVSGKTYADIVPVATAVSANRPIYLIYSGTRSVDHTSYLDNAPVYIPLALDEQWHSVEIIVDLEEGFSAVAYDGYTVIDEPTGLSLSDSIIIGQDGGITQIRNLAIDFDSYGDAEIVDAKVDPSYETKKQIISEHNPRLLIYEGHGMQNKPESEMPTGDDVMDCSVERLWILFDKARANGYVPITWQDVIDWKLGYKLLPKRCFVMMFDDWRFDNYVAYNLRKPFVQYNIKPGLAVITGTHPLTEEFVIDGNTYTAKDMVDMTMKAGWYPTSHTHLHRHNNNYTMTEMISLLKQDVLEANKYGIYSNIIVDPYGEMYPMFVPFMKTSGFVLGIVVVENTYNCKAINSYRMIRVETGNRVPVTTVLYPLT